MPKSQCISSAQCTPDITAFDHIVCVCALCRWLPKATVQAAFCSYPYDKIYGKGSDEWDSPQQEKEYKQWGMDIMVTGGLAILMTAPIGLIIIQKLGPKWLEQDVSQGMEKSIDDMVAKELEERKASQKKTGLPG